MNTSDSQVYTIALSLLHFLWQGAAIAALAGTLMLVLRRPSTRYLIGVGALVLMLLSFATTVALLSNANNAGSILSARAPAAALASPKVAIVSSLSMLWTSQAATSPDAFTWMARAWFAGVFVFGLRIVFGLLAIERLRRRSLVALSPPLVARFEALQARLGIDRVIHYCQCEAVSVPAVIGVFRPIVLLPLRALTGLSAEQIDAVVAHELGHIQRFDVAVNFLQVIAETLLFFHPAVWWLNKRIRAEREDCCDDVAVAACGNRASYARALAAMEGWRETPSFAMAATGGTVAARVARLLGVNRGEPGERAPRAIAAMLILTTALAAGVMSMGVAQPAFAQVGDPPPPPVVAVPDVPAPEVAPPAPPVPAVEVQPPTPAVPAIPMLNPQVAPPPPPLPVAPIPDLPRESEALKEPKAAKEPKAPKEPKVDKAPKPPKEPKIARAPKPPKEPKVAKPPKPPKEPKVAKDPEAAREPEVDREPRIERAEVEKAELREHAEVDAVRQERIEAREEASARSQTRDENDEAELRQRAEADAARQNGAGRGEASSNHNQNQTQNQNSDSRASYAAIALESAGVTPEYVRDIRATGRHAELGELIALHSVGVNANYVAVMRAHDANVDVHEIITTKSQLSAVNAQSNVAAGGKDLKVDTSIKIKSADAL